MYLNVNEIATDTTLRGLSAVVASRPLKCCILHVGSETKYDSKIHEQPGNRRSHFARAVHSRHRLPGRYGMIPFAANALQCIVNGEEKPQNCPSVPLGFRNPAGGGPSHGHRQICIKNLVKIAHVAPEICSRTDRQTDTETHRQTCSSQYFATAPAGEVTIVDNSIRQAGAMARGVRQWRTVVEKIISSACTASNHVRPCSMARM